MSQETLKRLVGALIVALVVWGVMSLASGSGWKAEAPAELSGLFTALDDSSSIDVVRFSGPGGAGVELRRSGAAWTVDGLPADSAMVARLVSALAEAEVGELVARNATNHARMGLAGDSTHRMEVEAGDFTGALLVGDQGSRYGTTYVRLPDADEVHLVDADLSAPARRPLDDWRSKRIVAVDTAAVARLAVERDGAAYVLERADTTWTFEDGAAADAQAVRSLLGELRDLRADGFLAEGDSVAALPEGGSVVAATADGTTLAAVRVGSGDGDRWARTEGDATTYRIASYRLDRLLPARGRVEPGG